MIPGTVTSCNCLHSCCCICKELYCVCQDAHWLCISFRQDMATFCLTWHTKSSITGPCEQGPHNARMYVLYIDVKIQIGSVQCMTSCVNIWGIFITISKQLRELDICISVSVFCILTSRYKEKLSVNYGRLASMFCCWCFNLSVIFFCCLIFKVGLLIVIRLCHVSDGDTDL